MSAFMKAASAYKDVGLKTQAAEHDQYQLVVMMFDTTLESINRARGAIQEGDVQAKVQQIAKAIRIIQEGLRTSLDLENGGELAANLANLYDYCVLRLTQANASNDAAMLEEVAGLIKPIAEAWKELRGGASKSAETSPATASSPTAPGPTAPKASPVARRMGNLYGQSVATAGA